MADFKFEVWPTEYRQITQYFGANPQNYAQFGLPGHDGVDLRAPEGSEIFCVAPGTVVRAHPYPQHNYGIHVRVAHEGGYLTTYAHLQQLFVSEGQQVEAGTVLGLADSTGNSFGHHLHFTLKKEGARYGNWPQNLIDPLPFLLPLMGWTRPAGPYVEGWVMNQGLIIYDGLAQASPGGVTLRVDDNQRHHVPGGTIMIVTGESKNGYTSVQVPKAEIETGGRGRDGDSDKDSEPRDDSPPLAIPSIAIFLDGWAWDEYLQVIDAPADTETQAAGTSASVIGSGRGYAINVRVGPGTDTAKIGALRNGSRVMILSEVEDGYRPIRARADDFVEVEQWPAEPLVMLDPAALSAGGQTSLRLPAYIYLGWAPADALQIVADEARPRRGGIQLRSRPDPSGRYVATLKSDAKISIAGLARNGQTPILVNRADLVLLAPSQPQIQAPQPFLDGRLVPIPLSHYLTRLTAGWALSTELLSFGDSGPSGGQSQEAPLPERALAGRFGLTLRAQPRRDASLVGFVPPLHEVAVTGVPQGEYTPLKVADAVLQPAASSGDPVPLAQTRIGLHASLNATIGEAEFNEFADLRPGVIKLLSHHSPEAIARLAAEHPRASWIIGVSLDLSQRRITPDRFVRDTLENVRRCLAALSGKDVVIELHHQPNLAQEGLGRSWADGTGFCNWWLAVLEAYRGALPDARFIYPGLSPGSSITGRKLDHIQFIEASRRAVEMADGLAMHLTWSTLFPAQRALELLDDIISRFRYKPIWITEASNNDARVPASHKAIQYLNFWHALQQRPLVQGVTFFVASSGDPAHAPQVWVGRGIGRMLGTR